MTATHPSLRFAPLQVSPNAQLPELRQPQGSIQANCLSLTARPPSWRQPGAEHLCICQAQWFLVAPDGHQVHCKGRVSSSRANACVCWFLLSSVLYYDQELDSVLWLKDTLLPRSQGRSEHPRGPRELAAHGQRWDLPSAGLSWGFKSCLEAGSL